MFQPENRWLPCFQRVWFQVFRQRSKAPEDGVHQHGFSGLSKHGSLKEIGWVVEAKNQLVNVTCLKRNVFIFGIAFFCCHLDEWATWMNKGDWWWLQSLMYFSIGYNKLTPSLTGDATDLVDMNFEFSGCGIWGFGIKIPSRNQSWSW